MTDLTLPDDQDEDEEMSDEESGSPDMPTTGWIGLKTVRLNDDSHSHKARNRLLTTTSGDIQICEELTYMDNIKLSNLLTESIEILVSDPPDSHVRLHLFSLGSVDRDVFLTRIAWDTQSISWSRVALPQG